MQAKKQKKNNEIYERWNHFSMNERHGKWKTKIIKYNKKKTRNKCLLNECNNAMLNIYLLCRRCTIFFLAPCQSNLVWLMCDACFIHCQGVCIVKDTHVLSISLFVFLCIFHLCFFCRNCWCWCWCFFRRWTMSLSFFTNHYFRNSKLDCFRSCELSVFEHTKSTLCYQLTTSLG